MSDQNDSRSQPADHGGDHVFPESLFAFGREGEMERTARISDDGAYRYYLTRRWGPKAGYVVWVMLNPSTADGLVDDPTIRRCIGFTKGWGYDALAVVNLYALRSTDPKALLTHPSPVGHENHQHVKRWLNGADLAVAAWGAFTVPKHVERSDWQGRLARPSIESYCRDYGTPLRCLGTTKSGDPRHPLYVRGDVALQPYGPWEVADAR